MVGLRNLLEDMRRGNPEENEEVYSPQVGRKGVWNTTATIANMQDQCLSSEREAVQLVRVHVLLEDMRQRHQVAHPQVHTAQERRKGVLGLVEGHTVV